MKQIIHYLSLLTFLALTASLSSAQEKKAGELSQSKFSVTLDMSSTVYRDSPAIAELTISNLMVNSDIAQSPSSVDTKDAQLTYNNRILAYETYPEFDLLSMMPAPVSLEIIDAQGHKAIPIQEPDPKAFVLLLPSMQYAVHTPNISILTNQSRTTMVDLSPWLSSVQSGDYKIKLRLYHNNHFYWLTNSIAIHLRDSADLATSLKSFTANKPYVVFSKALPPCLLKITPEQILQLKSKVPAELFNDISILLFLSVAGDANANLPALLSILDDVPPHLRDVRDALRYEVLLGNGDKQAADLIAKELIDKYPASSWRIKQVQMGKGLIAQMRLLASLIK